MNRTVFMLVLVSLFSVALVASSSYATGTTGRSGFMMFNSSDLIGAAVKDSHGEPMGIVDEVRVDPEGQAFAVVIHWGYGSYLYGEGGINSPAPFQEIRISQIKAGQVTGVLTADMEHLDFVPYLNPPKADSLQYRANTYEYYYSIQPYWTQSGSAGKSGFMEFNSSNLVGAAVENSCGKVVGILNEVMVDSDGHAFAVVNHGDYDLYGESGVNTPCPLKRYGSPRERAVKTSFFSKQIWSIWILHRTLTRSRRKLAKTRPISTNIMGFGPIGRRMVQSAK